MAAGECTIFKKAKHIIFDNYSVGLVDDATKEFAFEPVKDEFWRGHKRVLQDLKEK